MLKKNLLEETANKLKLLIRAEKASKNDYIFFPKKFPSDEHKRIKFLSVYIKKAMISSNSFLDNDLEDISAHCFRATLIVNKYKEGGAFFA